MEIVSNQIRNKSDRDFMAELAFACFSRTAQATEVRQYHAFLEPWFSKPARGTIIAYDRGSPVGFGIYGPMRKNAQQTFSYALQYAKAGVERDPNAMLVYGILVAPKHQRKGIGTALASRILNDNLASGTPQLFTDCINGPQSPGAGLFRRANYTELATFSKFYNDGSPATLFFKQLAAANGQKD
jgi:ribosomal protein S18 acetylase RimI-like enzyme